MVIGLTIPLFPFPPRCFVAWSCVVLVGGLLCYCCIKKQHRPLPLISSLLPVAVFCCCWEQRLKENGWVDKVPSLIISHRSNTPTHVLFFFSFLFNLFPVGESPLSSLNLPINLICSLTSVDWSASNGLLFTIPVSILLAFLKIESFSPGSHRFMVTSRFWIWVFFASVTHVFFRLTWVSVFSELGSSEKSCLGAFFLVLISWTEWC